MTKPVTLGPADSEHITRAVHALAMTMPADPQQMRAHTQSLTRLMDLRDALAAQQRAAQTAAAQLQVSAEWIRTHTDEALTMVDALTRGDDDGTARPPTDGPG